MKYPASILLAEDDEDDREIFRHVLHKTLPQAELTMQIDGEKLMHHLKNHKAPDLLFLDLNMPFKNGKECVKLIKTNPSFRDIPTIILSTSTYLEDIEETFRSGADLYVPKPSFLNDHIKILTHIFSMYSRDQLRVRDRKKFVLTAKDIG